MISNYVFQRFTIQNNTLSYLSNYDEFFNNNIKIETNELEKYLNSIIDQEYIVNDFKNLQKKSLFEKVNPIYEKLNSDGVTHLYFIKTNGEVLLRVHDYNKDLDIIDRYTFLKAKEIQCTFSGLEFGIKKNFTLRVVSPVFVDGKIIGYIEIGKEIDKIIEKIAKQMNFELIFAIKNSIYTNLNDIEKIDKYVISYKTIELNKDLSDFIKNSDDIETFNINKQDFIAYKRPLEDISKKALGFKIILINLTKEYKELNKQSLNYGFIMFLGTMLMILIGFFYSKAKQKEINKIFYRLKKAKNKVELLVKKQKVLHKNLEKLINLQDNIIVLTNGKEFSFANKQLFDFLGFENLVEFKKEHKCICEFFVEDDNFFHLKKISTNQNWLEEIKKLPTDERIVLIKNHNNKPFIFKLNINNYDDEAYIISFTDFTKNILDKKILEEKVLTDKLTHAYNREFFETNINIILNQHAEDSFYTAIVFFDIDYFKKINDKYGHDIGDEILKSFVKTLKSNSRVTSDILIRWGGEEFLMIIPIKNKDSLYFIMENYRKAIENNLFEKDIRITTSIGASIHNDLKNIENTIKEADIALYKAKTMGRNRVYIY